MTRPTFLWTPRDNHLIAGLGRIGPSHRRKDAIVTVDRWTKAKPDAPLFAEARTAGSIVTVPADTLTPR